MSPERENTRRFARRDRVRRRADFVRIQRTGARTTTRHFVMLLAPSGHRRLGVTVSRRVGNAVRRNRVKRLVREVFRRERELFPEGCDVVVVARSGADALDYAAARAEIAAAREAMARAAHRRERR